MTMRLLARMMAVATLPLALAACGNDTSTTNPLEVARQVFAATFSQDGAAPQTIPASQIQAAYAATQAPIALVTIESRQGQALILEIERNGSYQTFATSSRQVFVLRNGMITGTRGIGGDLMSSEVDGLLALVRARDTGRTPYDMRFLDGEDLIQTQSYTCDVFPDGTQTVSQGQIRTTATKMIANCTGETKPFTNTFLVDSSGYVLDSRQWLGDFSGYLRMQTLRK